MLGVALIGVVLAVLHPWHQKGAQAPADSPLAGDVLAADAAQDGGSR